MVSLEATSSAFEAEDADRVYAILLDAVTEDPLF
jgi:hypothetical protein